MKPNIKWAAGLWVAFVLAHVLVAWWGFIEPNQPRGDVMHVYFPWSQHAIQGKGIVGVTEPWVYPPVALVPMVLAQVVSPLFGYEIAWVVVVCVLDFFAFWFLVRNAQSHTRRIAAMFWIVFLVALGPIALYRIDAITVPIAVVALLWIRSHPVLASALLAIGAWIKIWPAAVLAAAFATLDRKRKYIEGTLVVSAIVVVVVVMGGGFGHLFGFLTMQSDRGLQAESVFATPYLWAAAFGVPDTGIVYNAEIITFQVQGAGTDVLSAVLTPLLLLVGAAIAVLALIGHRRGVSAQVLVPPTVLALVLAFIVFNKVGSPQFQTWLIAPLVFWLVWDRRAAWPYAVGGLCIAIATHVLYPLYYDRFLAASLDIIVVITLRNVLLIVLMVAATWRIARAALVKVSSPVLVLER